MNAPADNTSKLRLLRLFQLVSPALPVGAYAYSEGLEYAVHAGWVSDERTAEDWILGRLRGCLACVDLPLLGRLHAAFAACPTGNDIHADAAAEARRLSRMLLCLRESAQLRQAERDMGAALARLLVSLGMRQAAAWLGAAHTTYAAVFALAAASWHVPADEALMGFAFAWMENQVTAAVKLVPLGQSAGQRILLGGSAQIPDLVATALAMSDDDIGGGAPAWAIAACGHESLYTRLYRS